MFFEKKIGFFFGLVKTFLQTYAHKVVKRSETHIIAKKKSISCSFFIDKDDVLERMMNPNSQDESKQLLGHGGPVYSAHFSHDKNYLISSSEDGTGKHAVNMEMFVLGK